MNAIDIILLLIVLLCTYLGYLKGFIVSFVELLSWMGSLLLCFFLFSYSSFFVIKYITAGFWALPLSFLITILVIRLLFSFIIDRTLPLIPSSYYSSLRNRILGVVPGSINGVVYAGVLAVLLILFPFGRNLTNAVSDSVLVARYNEQFERIQEKVLPDLEDLLGKPDNQVTVDQGSKKFIKLPFKTENFKVRSDLESEMLKMVNAERRKAGLKPVKADTEMTAVARKHSADMFHRGYFSHFTPERKSPFDRMRAEKVRFLTAGENLALAPTLRVAHQGLMNSPGHRANILHPGFGRLGIGVLDGGFRGLMITQNFRN